MSFTVRQFWEGVQQLCHLVVYAGLVECDRSIPSDLTHGQMLKGLGDHFHLREQGR